jgi:hypothetical protein
MYLILLCNFIFFKLFKANAYFHISVTVFGIIILFIFFQVNAFSPIFFTSIPLIFVGIIISFGQLLLYFMIVPVSLSKSKNFISVACFSTVVSDLFSSVFMMSSFLFQLQSFFNDQLLFSFISILF